MNENENNGFDFTRRDFLRHGSLATMMAMLGGVELFADTNATATAQSKPTGPKVKIAVIGLGAWGREILNTLAVQPQADVAAICDTYAASVRRSASIAPGAAQTEDYKSILANKEIKAVVVATATHQHKQVVLDALKAGKHVYCEAPLANTLEDAKEIATAAKAAALKQVFQAGLQLRSNPQRQFLLPFIRSGALGQSVMARAQWHKKNTWRATAANADREKAINWRLDKAISLGLIGEMGIHSMDQAWLFLNVRPTAITGFSSLLFHKDGRDEPDTIQAIIEFAGGIRMIYDATLANSFDAEYEMLYGSDAAVMMRDSKAWLFKEVDSPLLGWEVYARKETFYKETGIALVAGASKSTGDQPVQEVPFTATPLAFALETFLRNAGDIGAAVEDAEGIYSDNAAAQAEHIGKVHRRPAAGFLEGYRATVLAIKAHEAVLANSRIELNKDLYELA
jgi:predicted dehydrogenase